ncbi:hypothetical protein BUALT_Bualt02G0035100 [Buddleja alternifolia]|uniref:Lysosomal Pro-X carboxypeptidase n=1 Tax=Buddleja alternifolia TaxID=168488 RepID=A0AAV6Y8A8_9LAMI|nr:hypothetical protein BUALT_Bualt02G0035100 [Buddleja alternifolia]
MMFSFRFLVQLLFHFYPLLLLHLFLQPVSSIFPHKIPRLSIHDYKQLESISRNPYKISSTSTTSNDDLKTYFYTQTLDHFNYGPQSYATFEQRYMVNFRNWGGADSNSPILAYLGAEAPLDQDLEVLGFLSDNSHTFKALQVYIEKRKLLSRRKRKNVVDNKTYENTENKKYIFWFRHLNHSYELTDYLDMIYSSAAQYNLRPVDKVRLMCNAVDGAPNGTDVLGRIFAGVVSYNGNQTCYDTNEYYDTHETLVGWQWQSCSEMVSPINGREGNDTMFPAAPFNLDEYIKYCKYFYGVAPRPHWVTTYYGGNDVKLVLHGFGSNIIFSNGLKDPCSGGGVLEDISESVLAVSTANGSHCLDILYAKKTDPEWLVVQRNTEVKIIQGWINEYYADLHDFKK